MVEVTVWDRTTRESTWEARREAETSMRESRSTSAAGENRLEEGGGFGTPEDSGGPVRGSPESSTMCSSKLTEGEQRLGCAGLVGDRDLDTVDVGGGWISAMVVV